MLMRIQSCARYVIRTVLNALVKQINVRHVTQNINYTKEQMVILINVSRIVLKNSMLKRKILLMTNLRKLVNNAMTIVINVKTPAKIAVLFVKKAYLNSLKRIYVKQLVVTDFT